MHILMLILLGLVILLIFHLGRRWFGATSARPAVHIWPFLVLWLSVSAANLAIAVLHSGYALETELGVFALVFGAPALAAIALRAFLRGARA